MDDPALESLMAAYLENRASEAEQAELLKQLEQHPELCEKLREQMLADHLLATQARPALDPEVILRAIPSQRGQLSGRVMVRIEPRSRWKQWLIRHHNRVAAVAFLMISALVLLFYSRSSNAPSGTVLAQITSVQGEAKLKRDQTTTQLLTATPLFRGDTLELGPTGLASLAFSDSTVVALSAGAVFTVSNSGEMQTMRPHLQHGTLEATVAKQAPGEPMIFSTPLGTAEVLGTVLKLAVREDLVALQVLEGRVRLKSGSGTESRDVSAGQGGELRPGRMRWFYTEQRDPLDWPFASHSPWNRPLGSGAKFSEASTPEFPLTRGAKANIFEYSHPVFKAAPTDPERPLAQRSGTKIFNLRIPDSARPDPSTHGAMHILDGVSQTAMEMNQIERLADGGLRAVDIVVTDLGGAGFAPDSIRVCGASGLGGLIRKGELRDGIRHALALSVIRQALSQTNGPGTAYRWPATKAPLSVGEGSKGLCQYGTLLAIPPDTDLKAIGVGSSGPAFEVARALQDYGGYIVESFGAGEKDIDFFVEPGAAREVPADFDAMLSKIIPHLKIVGNNSPQSPGGGGTPRRPQAPELGTQNKDEDF